MIELFNAFSFLLDAENYQDRCVGRTQTTKYIVSTAFSSDEGYETAILDKNGAHPVQRYKTKSLALKGHRYWVKTVDGRNTILKLGGLGGLVNDERIKLMPRRIGVRKHD